MLARLSAALALAFGPLLSGGPIVINEIHSAPRQKTVPEEFVELYNHGSAPVDLSGWYFSDGIALTLPAGTVLGPGEYLVAAKDPATLAALYPGVRALGPYEGYLDNQGELLVLRNSSGFREDQVDYGLGFPWPTVGGPSGWSMELIHPDLDNDLGGSWRASNPGLDTSSTLVPVGALWRYRKGSAEASNPSSAWRELEFDDGGWTEGRLPVGYGETFIATSLPDMRNGYASVFLRREFEVPDASQVGALTLEVQYDDGFNAWINGTWVAGSNMPSPEPAFDATASSALEDLEFNAFGLPPPRTYLRAGRNVLCLQLHNSSLGGSSDAFLDARLVSGAAGAGPTPGTRNSVFAANAPPQLRQVDHAPAEPRSGDAVVITIKATDPHGVAEVNLEYQVVEPGAFVELGDPEYLEGWISLPMNDDGSGGDVATGDSTFTAVVPPEVQSHRRLVRYRFEARDSTGAPLRVPYPDDPQPNFAYFVHDGSPGWSGAVNPAGTVQQRQVVDYGPEVFERLPIYHLLAKRASTEDCTWNSKYGGENYLWHGALVAEGRVYDHISYRARGGVWRYAMGKNMWKFDFTRGHSFAARDDFRRRYRTRWDKLNFSAVIQQGDYLHRGEQGLFESAGFKLFNLAGVEAPLTHFLHFHIVDEAEEVGPTQYDGDYWGLYLAMEQPDGRLLDEHGLPDGNLYKMESGTGELNNQGPTAATDKSDLNAFQTAYQGGTPTDDWWRQTLDLESYYSYRSVLEAIHHYDIGAGKNYFYYLNPDTGQWKTLPWDLDLIWANNMFGDGNEPFRSRVLARPAFALEYRNRMREVRDLLYNPDQMNPLLDELAAMVRGPTGPSPVDADRARWDYNPLMVNAALVNLSKAGHGRFYQSAADRTFPGMVRLMKDYVVSRGAWIDANILPDAAIPQRPTVTWIGPAGYPLDVLSFRVSAFADPQGAATFGALRWRIAEVTPPGAPALDPLRPRLFEVMSLWESGDLTPWQPEIAIPAGVAAMGGRYRVRARMKDSTGRWSQWSAAHEFTAGASTAPLPAQEHLRISEILYQPEEGLDHEFIELVNTGTEPLDLTAVSFLDGIEFSFAGSAVEVLLPREHVVVVQNLPVFRARYGPEPLVAGEYGGRLANEGERLLLRFGPSVTILDFEYRDLWEPLASGGGHSLVVKDPRAPASSWGLSSSWQPSLEPGGSPGRPEGQGPPEGGLQLPGDGNGDGGLDLADAVALLLILYQGGAVNLPCEGPAGAGGNLELLDLNGDRALDVADPLHLLSFLFRSGPPPNQGLVCRRLLGCPSTCGF